MKLIIPTAWVLLLGVVCAAVFGVGVWLLVVSNAWLITLIGIVCLLAALLILGWYLSGTTLLVTGTQVRRLLGRGSLPIAQITEVDVAAGSGSSTSAWMVAVHGADGQVLTGGAWLKPERAEREAAALRARWGLDEHSRDTPPRLPAEAPAPTWTQGTAQTAGEQPVGLPVEQSVEALVQPWTAVPEPAAARHGALADPSLSSADGADREDDEPVFIPRRSRPE